MGSLQRYWYLIRLVLHEPRHPAADKRDPIGLHQAAHNPRAPPQPPPPLPPHTAGSRTAPSLPTRRRGRTFSSSAPHPRHLTIGCHHIADAPVAANRRAHRRLLPHRGGGAKGRGGAEARRAPFNTADGAVLLACSGVAGAPAPPVRWRLSGGRGRGRRPRPPLHQPREGPRGWRAAGGGERGWAFFVWILIGMDGQRGDRRRRRTGDALGSLGSGRGGRRRKAALRLAPSTACCSLLSHQGFFLLPSGSPTVVCWGEPG